MGRGRATRHLESGDGPGDETFSTNGRSRFFWRLTKRLSEGLRFVVLPGFFYKTKTPSVSRVIASDKVL